MTLFIEGTAFPIGEKNVNGWGVPESESENAISTLKSSVVRICSREDPHGCDIKEDPKAEIGNVVDAWRDGNLIKAKVAITDSIASQKIKDKTWNNTWSIYGKAPKVVDGWPTNFQARSLTLVQNPAWKNATWNMAASEGEDIKLITFSDFLIASQEGDNIADEDKIKDLETKLEAANKLIEELKPKADSVAGLEKQVTELTASNEQLTKDLGDKTKLVASLEIEKGKSIPLEEIEKKIAAAIADHDKEVEARSTLAASRTRFVAARKGALGIDTKPEEFTSLSAADFNTLAAELETKLAAGGNGSGRVPEFPAEPSTKTGFTVGRPNPKKPSEWGTN